MEPRHRSCCSESPSQRLSRLPAPTHALSFPASSGIAYRRSASAPCASLTNGYMTENVQEGSLPGRTLGSYVSRRLTSKTGVTIRNLRRVRYLFRLRDVR